MADEFIQVCSGVQKKLVEKIDESTGKNYYAEEVVVTGGSSVNVSVDNTDVIAAQDATTEKVELLRQQLVTLLGDEESLKTLSTQTNTLLTTLGTYNDQVESLLGTVGSNTTNLQALLTQLGLNTDQVETLLQVVANKLDTVHADLATENTSLTNGTQKAQITSLPTASRSPSFSRATTSGVVLAGAKSVSFCAVSGLCTVMGTTLLQEETVSFEAPGADTLAAIAYTVATGEIVIVEVR